MTRFSAFAILLGLLSVQAYMPMMMKASNPTTKSVQTSRRDAIGAGAAFLAAVTLAAPQASFAGSLEINNPIPDNEYVPAQQARSDKLDVNSAFVGDYKRLPGFFPHAAGMIASHGPYEKVSDIYKIKGLTENDKKAFKRFEGELVALPPHQRSFNERINARVST